MCNPVDKGEREFAQGRLFRRVDGDLLEVSQNLSGGGSFLRGLDCDISHVKCRNVLGATPAAFDIGAVVGPPSAAHNYVGAFVLLAHIPKLVAAIEWDEFAEWKAAANANGFIRGVILDDSHSSADHRKNAANCDILSCERI